jgi:hypothetical protein
MKLTKTVQAHIAAQTKCLETGEAITVKTRSGTMVYTRTEQGNGVVGTTLAGRP